jgi:DNA-directed RNA polymerase specialized sigma24 family protein
MPSSAKRCCGLARRTGISFAADVEEYRFEDIAEQLDMSYAAVRKRYERAKKRLKHDIVQKEEGEDERSFSY